MDRRETNQQWYSRFDEKRMVLVVNEDSEDEFEVPAKYEVCGTCDGKGHHVNPSIDSNGLSAEDFDEDPDFREDYFEGRYDVACNECGGARVVPAMDEDRTTKEEREKVEEEIDANYRHQQEMWYERKMGY